MSEVIFNYKNTIIINECKKDEKIKDIIKEFTDKHKIDFNNTNFIIQGKPITNFELTFIELISSIDKLKNKIEIFVATKNQKFPEFEIIYRNTGKGSKIRLFGSKFLKKIV